MSNMKTGEFVGVKIDGTVGCPILKVCTVSDDGFTLAWPHDGETKKYAYRTGASRCWIGINKSELRDAVEGCGCFRCESGLVGLALCAE